MISLAILFLFSCGNTENNQPEYSAHGEQVFTDIPLDYAKGFIVKKDGNVTILTVVQPWQDAEQGFSYYLYPGSFEKLPKMYADKPLIRTPIEKAVSYSTTHLGMLRELGVISTLKGFSEPKYVYDEALRMQMESGAIEKVGDSKEIDYEKLIALQPEAIFMYGIDNKFLSSISKLEELELQTVLISEYMENHPLGQAEWIKFIGYFYEKEAEAIEFFNVVKDNYESLSAKTTDIEKPTILCNMPWKETWYMSGGRSFTAQLIADAGGQYLWADDDTEGSLKLDFEVVLDKAIGADIWLFPGDAVKKEDIIAVCSGCDAFNAYGQSKIYSNYNRVNEFGGNDYWEGGIIRPDIMLRDLIHIFHPEVSSAESLYFCFQID